MLGTEDLPEPSCEPDGFLDGEHAEKRVALLDVRCEVSHVNRFVAIHHDLCHINSETTPLATRSHITHPTFRPHAFRDDIKDGRLPCSGRAHD